MSTDEFHLDVTKLPQHIAIIMDGNGRWAKQNHLSKINGYRKGISTAENIIKAVVKMKIKFLTIYAFSSENWHRSPQEIQDFMRLFYDYLSSDLSKLIANNIRIIFIGDHSKINKNILILMKKLEKNSEKNKFFVIVAFSYGGRQEIWQTSLKLAKKIISQQTPLNDIDNLPIQLFDDIINPYSIPNPDLLIRTGGNYRVSNFLLWQIAYTELYFSDKMWPEFTSEDLKEAIIDYSNRYRKYGRNNN